MADVRAALSFLTPFGGGRPPDPGTLDWFPEVGAAIGLALGGLWWATTKAWTAPVAAAVVVAADLAVTGLLHFDGLVDSADGLLPPLPRRRRLEVMADPGAGAFGVGAGAGTLLLRWAALAALRPGVVLLGGLWCLSRTVMAVVARTQPYARREGGLATAFSSPAAGPSADPSARPPAPRPPVTTRQWAALSGGAVLAGALLLWWRPGPGAASGAAAVVAAGLVLLLARRRIGGYTGDVLGACGVLAETAGLLVAAARW
jgi:adenosylcobinamide-GDP ribazoletransferase